MLYGEPPPKEKAQQCRCCIPGLICKDLLTKKAPRKDDIMVTCIGGPSAADYGHPHSTRFSSHIGIQIVEHVCGDQRESFDRTFGA